MNKTIEVQILKNTYKVGFPNTGEFMEIRALKNTLVRELTSNNLYDQYAALLGEMIAVYNVMIPQLEKDLNVDSILKLSMVESKTLLDSYTDIYKPFFDKWMGIVTNPNKEESEMND